MSRTRIYKNNAARQKAYRRRLAIDASAQWATPDSFVQAWSDRLGGFSLDVCASAENTKCARFFTIKQDGLEQVWEGRVWCNPPYHRTMIGKWVEKASESVTAGTAELVCMLLPARVDTSWWHRFIEDKAAVHHIEGRIRFIGRASGSPREPSCIVIFRSATDARSVALGG